MNKKHNKYKECQGCAIIDKCTIKPTYKYETHTEECPCIKCLVKGICKKSCKLYDLYMYAEKRNESMG